MANEIKSGFGKAFDGHLARKMEDVREMAERKFRHLSPAAREAQVIGYMKATVAVEMQAERMRRARIAAAAKPVVIPTATAPAAKPTAMQCVVTGRLSAMTIIARRPVVTSRPAP